MTASPRFPLGQLLSIPGAIAALQAAGMTPLSLLVNELALQDGGRIFSSYCFAGSTKVWIITEADRSATTVLLPEEY